MYRSLSEIIKYKIGTVDGTAGTVSDFLFDDKERVVRYVVVNSGSWLLGREALISPVAVDSIDNDDRMLKTILSKAAIEDAPGIETDQPVSRQYEMELASYYDWPVYWAPMPPSNVPGLAATEVAVKSCDQHLRSTKEVIGYSINCIGDSMGHVEDLIVDLDSWIVRYLVIDTSNWLPGKKVIVGFDWLTDIRWDEQAVFVDLTRKQIETAPAWDPRIPVNRDYETTLHDYYGRPTHWS